jgi:hypothetical protein
MITLRRAADQERHEKTRPNEQEENVELQAYLDQHPNGHFTALAHGCRRWT